MSEAPEIAAAEETPAEPPAFDWKGELRGLVLMLLAVIAFHSFVAKPFYIPSASMAPNLWVGDRLIVSKYPYGWNWASASFHLLPRGTWRLFGGTPEHGDVVIVVPRGQRDDYIKRVVALPGDRIAVKGGQIILNGKPVPQAVEPPIELPLDALRSQNAGPFDEACDAIKYPGMLARKPSGEMICNLPLLRETMPNGATYLVADTHSLEADQMSEILVPPGHVFLMGDNRGDSADSRLPLEREGLGGPVPLSDIGGRAEFTTFSLDGTSGWNPLTWWRALRGGRAARNLRPPLEGHMR